MEVASVTWTSSHTSDSVNLCSWGSQTAHLAGRLPLRWACLAGPGGKVSKLFSGIFTNSFHQGGILNALLVRTTRQSQRGHYVHVLEH